jgi:hypothetical protein
MASQDLSIILKLKDEATKQLQGFTSSLEAHRGSFKTMATAGTLAFGGLATAIGFSVKEAIESESAQNRLVQILKTTHGATQEQIDLLNEQAKALQKVGVVSDDNVTMVQSQLATFDLTVDTLHKLTPSILDYVVAEKGATATTEDFKQMTNGLAQALQGNFASLTRTGFVLDDATKALISNGTEAERTQALIEVLGSTYEGFNEKARETTEGGLQVLRNNFQDLQNTIGDQFLPILNDLVMAVTPIIEKIAEWVAENPKLTRNILLVTLGITGLVAILGILGMLILTVTPAIAGIGATLGLISLPMLAIIALIGVIVYTISWWVKNWQENMETIKWAFEIVRDKIVDVWEGIKNAFKSAVDWIISNTIDPLLKSIQRIIDLAKDAMSAVGNVGGNIKSGASSLLNKINPFSSKSVNDAIISPKGDIITTHPDDYLIATKNPKSLGGGGLVLNINTMVGDDAYAEEMGNKILNTLRLQAQM